MNLSGWNRGRAKNLFAGHTAYSIVLEVPDSELLARAGGRRRIGVWALSRLATDAGGWRSINRVGLPMVHPLFSQCNEDLGNGLNGGRPSDDLNIHGETVAQAIAGVVAAAGTAADPRAYGETVARRFCPNLLPDVLFSLAANTPVSMGIGKESVTSKTSACFPYVLPTTQQTFPPHFVWKRSSVFWSVGGDRHP